MVPHHSISNMIVKRYCGENTWRVTSWEDITMPEFIKIKKYQIFEKYSKIPELPDEKKERFVKDFKIDNLTFLSLIKSR